MSLNIPVLDISQGFSDAVFIKELTHACTEWGFFQITGHGIDPRLRQKLFKNVEDFFSLPKFQKLKLSRTQDNFWGYYDKEFTKNKIDSKEIYDIDATREQFKLECPEFAVPWPKDLPELKPAVLEWLTVVESLSLNLLGSICIALGEPSTTLNPFFLKNHTSFLRFNYYPNLVERNIEEKNDESYLGIHPHTDAGALTVLAQDTVPGLQIKKGDTWHTVIPIDEGLIVNIGDMVQIWSNDRFKAPEHRVLASDDKDRYSAPYFYNPSYETICEPLVAEPNDSKYRPVSWRDFRRGRAAGDYADKGEENHISWCMI